MDRKKFLRDPAVEKWLSNYRVENHKSKVGCLYDFIRFIEGLEAFKDVSPDRLVKFQREAVKRGDEYAVLDVLQNYINGKDGTYKSLNARYSTIRGFFRKNRAPLPDDDFEIHANRERVKERLSVDVIKTLIKHSPAGWGAIYLTLWMGLMDQERFIKFNSECGPALAEHLRKHGADTPFVFEFDGRKQSRDKSRFYTFIGRDALMAWAEYFERIRGWPDDGGPVFLDRCQNHVSKNAISQFHLRLLERLKFIKRGGGSSSKRYGYNLHEIRDVARTLLHLQGKKDGLDLEVIEFIMGHIPDPNQYDKFYMDREYTMEQYRLAEKHLNIMSGIGSGPTANNIDEVIDQIINSKPLIEKLADALAVQAGMKMVMVEDEKDPGE